VRRRSEWLNNTAYVAAAHEGVPPGTVELGVIARVAERHKIMMEFPHPSSRQTLGP